MRTTTPKFCRFCGSTCAWRDVKEENKIRREWMCKDCGVVYKMVRRQVKND